MQKSDFAAGAALASLSFSLTTLALLTSRGVIDNQEVEQLRVAVKASLEVSRAKLGDGAVDAALAMIEQNDQILAMGSLAPSGDRDRAH